jgi:trk system potassium uptake protein TrkA
MHIIIVGCGRVGSELALELEKDSQSVSVIDQKASSLAVLPTWFKGQKVNGIPYRINVLKKAGIDRADAVAAVSDDDNLNVIVCRIAKETFGIENIVARMYDKKRAEIYKRLGIQTIPTLLWTISQVLSKLEPERSLSEFEDQTGKVSLISISPHKSWLLQTVETVEQMSQSKVAFIERYGNSFIPSLDTILQEGDVIHVLVETKDIRSINDVFVKPLVIPVDVQW